MTPEVVISIASFIFGVLVTIVASAVRLTFAMSRYVTRDELERHIDRVIDTFTRILDDRLQNLEKRLDRLEDK